MLLAHDNFASLGLFVHIIRFARGFGKMNVTEKQKGILLSFMQRYPDFGRGRLRYNSENKRKIDEFWEKLSIMLNTAACGPRKSCKEWAKTWRDWKCNTLKKVAKHKSYMTSTDGGSPKYLELTVIEKKFDTRGQWFNRNT
ncbi:PREDICTED: uncharacterized protein LOC108781631 [Cyphomyrmex costatus]|uniref:Regulatory protein zeste n=1 Tax=Cyphomyrmex costatus TaxID=456900 RepID=A0A151I7J2_9HYME|nr:PREDICTED: uncharacterized protein LOC108781631 [Cyphomyrmex costatus]KYM94068.1 hypothetical protein ALC62_15295 [Cyphomyrmex costatus]